jgi:hypothetical protein
MCYNKYMTPQQILEQLAKLAEEWDTNFYYGTGGEYDAGHDAGMQTAADRLKDFIIEVEGRMGL